MRAVGRVKQYVRHPSYSLMRLLARFGVFRLLLPKLVAIKKLGNKVDGKAADIKTAFPMVNPAIVVSELENHGVSFGLTLPNDVLEGILSFARNNRCYADRESDKGFFFDEHSQACEVLGKEILVAQYFNTTTECDQISRLIHDPMFLEVAKGYLGAGAKFVGANLWWTFPVDALDEDRQRHAHKFHRDVDDFKFFKFFFYLTDVELGDGGHVVVKNFKDKPPVTSFFDKWNIRRYSDEEVEAIYPDEDIIEVAGPAGAGFAEDTWSIHKGKTPKKSARLLLQFQFALNDYGVVNDERELEKLKAIRSM